MFVAAICAEEMLVALIGRESRCDDVAPDPAVGGDDSPAAAAGAGTGSADEDEDDSVAERWVEQI